MTFFRPINRSSQAVTVHQAVTRCKKKKKKHSLTMYEVAAVKENRIIGTLRDS